MPGNWNENKQVIEQMTGLLERIEKALPRMEINIPGMDQLPEILINPGPWHLLLLFMVCSLLMIWKLNTIEKKGFEGTMVGTLIMPFCSGFANLAFAVVMADSKGGGSLVLENCIVNNVTNLTLVLALPAMLWGIKITKNSNETGEKETESKISYFSLLLSLIAMIFFTSVVWLLSKDKVLNASDGMVLTGLFFFWQAFHVVDVMKNNVRKNRSIASSVVFDFIVAGLCAWGSFYSIDGLVTWVSQQKSGFISRENLGILSGFIMVIPNAMLAFYYSAKGRSDIAYSSQIGDCHICIPLCIGLYAMNAPISIPATFGPGVVIIIGSGITLFLFTAILGKLPRIMGIALALSYSIFLYKGIIS